MPIIINASKDVYASEHDPAVNKNGAFLVIGTFSLAGNRTRTFLHFDLSAISETARLKSAKLFLRQEYYSYALAETLIFDAHRIVADWSETSLTWNAQPATASPAVTGLSCPYTDTTVWRNWDITALIEECRTNPYYGIMLRSHTETPLSNDRKFSSREEGHAPYLEITLKSSAKVWNGSAWVEKPIKVWNGSAWVEKPVKVWNGSAWVEK